MLTPPQVPIRSSVSTVGDVLDGLELDVTEMQVLDGLGVNLADAQPTLVAIAALAWLQARRSTHPGISWEDAEPLILIAIT